MSLGLQLLEAQTELDRFDHSTEYTCGWRKGGLHFKIVTSSQVKLSVCSSTHDQCVSHTHTFKQLIACCIKHLNKKNNMYNYYIPLEYIHTTNIHKLFHIYTSYFVLLLGVSSSCKFCVLSIIIIITYIYLYNKRDRFTHQQ